MSYGILYQDVTISQMIPPGRDAEKSLHDPQRLAALEETGLLDSPIEAVFDRFTDLVSKIIGAPVALVSLVDKERQFFKSSVGLSEPYHSARETPLSHSFCQHVVSSRENFIVADARVHPLVQDNEAIEDLGVVAYAGIPLQLPDGHILGSLCAIDTQPREWTTREIEILTGLAASVVTEIELRMAAAALRRQSQELRELEIARDDTVKLLVHDLRTPLFSLMSGISAVETCGELNDTQRQLLAISQRGGSTILRMINDLLDLSRSETGQLVLELASVRPEILVDTAREQVEHLAQAKHLWFETSFAPALPAFSGDEEKLRRVLVNLLGNAIRHTSSYGQVKVEVSLLTEEKSLLFTVSDSGEGIPAEAFERIFEKFGQVNPRRSGRGTSGLGLTLCRAVIEAHGGRIWVESEVGLGSTFRFTLPISSFEN